MVRKYCQKEKASSAQIFKNVSKLVYFFVNDFSFLHSGYILLGTVSNLKVVRVLIVELVLDLTIIHVAEILLAGC
jgi:hypothetical protein